VGDFVGFVGPAYEAASDHAEHQQLINWYTEVDQTKFGGRLPESPSSVASQRFIRRPGTDALHAQVRAEVRGLHVCRAARRCSPWSADTLYSVSQLWVATAVGTLEHVAGRVYITDNGVSAYITDGANRYYYTWGTSTFAATADGAFNGGDVCDEVDNFIIYNRPGTNQFGCTNVGDPSSPGELNLGSKIGYPDNIVALIADRRQSHSCWASSL
jgi:hypothetical protein